MYILGINLSHHSSTCLLNDGKIVYYIEEERLSRKKEHQIGKDSKIRESIKGVECIKNYTDTIDYVIISSFRTIDFIEEEIIQSLGDWFNNNGINVGEFIYYLEQHHLFHASNAFYASGFEESACLVIDGSGCFTKTNKNGNPFREIESIYSCSYESGIKEYFKHYSTRGEGCYNELKIESIENSTYVFSDSISCGDLFSKASVCFGMGDKDNAGKIMGMSSYGNCEKYDRWYASIDEISITNNNIIIPEFCKTYESFQEKSNLAAKIQKETKEHTISLIHKALNQTNSNNIVLSGGYFLNCVNNYEYIKEFPDINFYIDPISHDGGTSIGAAKYFWYDLTSSKNKYPIKDLYLGI